MAECIGDDRPEYAGVKGHNRAGDTGHAGRHDDEQFAPTDAGEVGTNQQRRLDHTDKDICRRRHADRPADAQRLLEHHRERAHHDRQHAPVIEHRRQGTHHQNHWQCLKGENETGPGSSLRIWQQGAAEKAENEARPGAACGGDGQEDVVARRKRLPRTGQPKDRHGERELQANATDDGSPRDGGSLAGDGPCQTQEEQIADGGLQHGIQRAGVPPRVPALGLI